MAPAGEERPRLVLTTPGEAAREFTLSKARVSLGRATTSDIVLRDWAVSRHHARIEHAAEGYLLVDLESTNGTFVNGARETRRVLTAGDELTLGGCSLRFEVGGDEDLSSPRLIDSAAKVLMPAASRLPVHLEEQEVPRVAVHTAARTWEVSFRDEVLTIGRGGDNDVVIDDPSVSRDHALIERRGTAFLLRDLASSGGTWVGGERVGRRTLDDGDGVRIGSARLVFKHAHAARNLVLDDEDPSGVGRRPLVVIPGFAGSNLWLGKERVWPTIRMHEIADALQLAHPLEPRGVIDEIVIVPNLIRLDQYGVLTGYLRESLGYQPGVDLLEFAYDFRQDNRDSARRLAAAIEQWRVTAPITLIAHSMGCLIARYYVERLGGAGRVERVILIGGPHGGTPSAYATLLRGPNVLPLGLLNQRLRHMIGTFPSSYQTLPLDRCLADGDVAVDVWSDESWVHDEHRPLLRNARAFREELGTRSSVPAVCVFGYGLPTVTGAVVRRDAAGQFLKADFLTASAGDGTIPERSAVLPHAEIHPVRQHHGSLYTDNDVKMRLKIELTR